MRDTRDGDYVLNMKYEMFAIKRVETVIFKEAKNPKIMYHWTTTCNFKIINN